MKAAIFLNSVIFGTILIALSSQSFSAEYTCVDQNFNARYKLYTESGKKTGTVKTIVNDYEHNYRVIERGKTDFHFTYGTRFDFGVGKGCVKMACYTMCIPFFNDYYEGGRPECSKWADYNFSGVVEESISELKKNLDVEIFETIPRKLFGKSERKYQENTTCYPNRILKLKNFYSGLALTADGRGLYLDRLESRNVSDILKFPLEITELETLKKFHSNFESLANQLESGSITFFDHSNYTVPFDIRKIKKAQCWASDTPIAFEVNGDKLDIATAKNKRQGTIVTTDGTTKVLFAGYRAEPAYYVRDGVFTFEHSLCFVQ